MPRMRPWEPTEAPAEARAIFDAFLAKRGNVPNLFRTLVRRPKFMAAANQLMKALYDEEGTVPGGLKELLAVRVSQLNTCAYCAASHTALAKMAGASEETLAQLEKGPGAFPPAEAAALELVEWMTRHPERGLSDELYERVQQSWDEGQIIEIMGVAASFNFFNRLANALDVEITR